MTTPTMTVTTVNTGAAAAPAAKTSEQTPTGAPTAEAAPAALAAPANIEASPTPEAAPAPAAGPAAADGTISYEPTGDAGMDLALGFLGKLGIAPDTPAMVAAGEGNFALLKAELALMGDKAKGWEQIVALGEQSLGNLQATHKAAEQKRTDAILSAFGEDKEAAAAEWSKVQSWAKEHAEPEERTAVNAALAAGGIAAKAMAQYLGGLYRASSQAEIDPAVVTHNGGNSGGDNGALSPAAYKAAVLALRAKLGQGMDGSPEYKALQARRVAYRG